MKFSWVRLAQYGLLLLVFLGLLIGVAAARASEPGMGYWFTETLTVDHVVLPPGISIDTCDSNVEQRGCITLENNSESILYVLSLNYKDVLVMKTPDPNWKSRVNMAHEVASYTISPSHPRKLTMEALIDLDGSLVDKNVLADAPPPENASIPGPQKSELLLVFDGQVIEVPFTVSYALNPDFDDGTGVDQGSIEDITPTDGASPTATPPGVVAITQADRNITLAIGLAGMAVLLVAGWLVWKRVGRRK